MVDEKQTMIKAGIVPFIPAAAMENWRFLVMQPRGAKPELGPPPWQLCKGTRMQRVDGHWRDMQPGELAGEHAETLEQTALREAEEELGLMQSLILRMYDLGRREIISASTGEAKPLWLFGAEMQAEEPLLSPQASTQARQWMGLADFQARGRADHVVMLTQVIGVLAAR